jgi:hypothetical protein
LSHAANSFFKRAHSRCCCLGPQWFPCTSVGFTSGTTIDCLLSEGTGKNLVFRVKVRFAAAAVVAWFVPIALAFLSAQVGLIMSRVSVDTITYPTPVLVGRSIRKLVGVVKSTV